MAGNARFHDKLHRKNHHSNPTDGFPDSAVDPIASREEPFQGDFVINGLLSSSLGIDILSANIRGNLNAENIYVRDTTYTNFISGQGTETIISDGALTGYGDFTCTLDFQNGVYLNTPNTYILGDSYITGQLSAGTLEINTDANIHNNLQVDGSATIDIDLTVSNNATIDGNLLVRGNLSALGDVSVIETNMISTSAVTITNHAPLDAALTVHQYGDLSAIASFSYGPNSDIVVINNDGIVLNSGSISIIAGDINVGGVVVAPNITGLQDASGYWDNGYQVLTSTSAYWDNSYQTLTSTSAYWDSAYIALTSTSANWNSVYNTVSSISSFIKYKTESSFTALTSTSSDWNTAYWVITSLQDSITGKWETTYNTVSVNSGDWDATKSTVDTRKEFWNCVYNGVVLLSGGWDDASTKVRNISSVFSTVQLASANWNASFVALTSTSANWNASFVALTSTSANWNVSFNALTASSGSWLSGNSDIEYRSKTLNTNSISTIDARVYGALYYTVTSFVMAPSNTLSATTSTPSYMFVSVSGTGTSTIKLPSISANETGLKYYIKNTSSENNRIIEVIDSNGTPANGTPLVGNNNSYVEIIFDGIVWQTIAMA